MSTARGELSPSCYEGEDWSGQTCGPVYTNEALRSAEPDQAESALSDGEASLLERVRGLGRRLMNLARLG